MFSKQSWGGFVFTSRYWRQYLSFVLLFYIDQETEGSGEGMGGVENNEENEIWSCKQWKGQPGICPKSLQSVAARGSLRGSFRDHRHVGTARLPGQVPPALLRIILPNSSKAFFKKNLLWKNLPKETAYTRISNSPFWKTIYFAFQDSFCNQLKNNLPVTYF